MARMVSSRLSCAKRAASKAIASVESGDGAAPAQRGDCGRGRTTWMSAQQVHQYVMTQSLSHGQHAHQYGSV